MFAVICIVIRLPAFLNHLLISVVFAAASASAAAARLLNTALYKSLFEQ